MVVGPQHRGVIERILCHIGKGVVVGSRVFLFGKAVQEGDNLAAGAGIGGHKGSIGHAVGDAVFYRPEHCLVVEGSFRHVCEFVFGGLGLLCAGSTPQEGDNLAAGTGGFRRKGGGAHAVGDLRLVVHCPIDGVDVEGVLPQIGEGGLRSKYTGQQAQNHSQGQQQRKQSSGKLGVHSVHSPYVNIFRKRPSHRAPFWRIYYSIFFGYEQAAFPAASPGKAAKMQIYSHCAV